MRKAYFVAVLLLTFSLFSSCRKNTFPKTCHGVDVSENQGDINWKTLKKQNVLSLQFAIIRSTVGCERFDYKFLHNIKEARKNGFIVGAYHYYRPDENSTKQARMYIKSLRAAGITSGDIIPLLDVERGPKRQSEERLRVGLKNWLRIVEEEFGVKPFVYSSCEYMKQYLDKEITHAEYPLWISAPSTSRDDDPYVKRALIRQYSQTLTLPGIPDNVVDANRMEGANMERILLD